MSEYPRPESGYSLIPARFRPDQIVGGLAVVSDLGWLVYALAFVARVPSHRSATAHAFAVTVVGLLIVGLVSVVVALHVGMARSRRSALIGSLALALGGLAFEASVHLNAFAVVRDGVLTLYSFLRLFGLFGPRPLRRRDVRP